MNIIGIDYGLSKTGVAIATSPLASPLRVIKHSSEVELISEIKKLIKSHSVEKLVVGIADGKIAQIQSNFADKLRNEVAIPVETADETLSTHDAKFLSQESGMKRTKRKKHEDAFAAAIMLQRYLDNQ